MTLALQNTCAILAGISKCPELDLDAEEAKQVAAAYANVARHYNFYVNEKAADWYNLLTVAGAVFGSKIIAIRMRKKQEAKLTAPKPAFTQPQRVAPTTAPPGANTGMNTNAPPPAPQPKTPLAPAPAMAMPPAEPDYASEDQG